MLEPWPDGSISTPEGRLRPLPRAGTVKDSSKMSLGLDRGCIEAFLSLNLIFGVASLERAPCPLLSGGLPSRAPELEPYDTRIPH